MGKPHVTQSRMTHGMQIINKACHSLSGVAERLQHTVCKFSELIFTTVLYLQATAAYVWASHL